ncbi:noggin-1 [Trichomycterus rosablanca]|uniref:noggin-1 n=1 Tax=Trichomycterus rosablanca TaxID=2290929 RepID=UPI002F352DDF
MERLATAVCMLFAALALRAHLGACQHFYLLRPIPSDSLPLVELKEDPDPALDPRERDLNATELRTILGDWDARFLSVTPPSERQEEEDDAANEFLPDGPMPAHIRALDLDAPFVPGARRRKTGRKLKRRLQMWLWARSACPVRYTWTDLGSRFWPQYVRVGGCRTERSCSVPEGMTCAPAGSTRVTLLRWRCARRRGALKCAWIPVQYPIITECKCSCSN